MKTEQLTSEIGKPILKPLGYLQGILLLCVLSTPFLWIWIDWSITWRVGLTGFFGLLITSFISTVVRKTVNAQIEKTLEEDKKSTVRKSKFMEKLEKAMEENEFKKKRFKDKLDKLSSN